MSAYRIDLVDGEGRWMTISVERLESPPDVVAGVGPIDVAFRVVARRKQELVHRATWGVPEEYVQAWRKLWGRSLIPHRRRAAMLNSFERGVLGLYVRRFPAIVTGGSEFVVTTDDHDFFVGLDRPVTPGLDLDEVLALVESDLVEFLLYAREVGDSQEQANSQGIRSLPRDALSRAWDAYEPLLRDAEGAAVKAAYPRLSEYFRGLGEIARSLSSGALPERAPVIKLTIQASKALHAVHAAMRERSGEASPAVTTSVDAYIARAPHESLAITEVELDNIRCFDHLRLDLAENRDAPLAWTLLLGDNARGKSTLLRAIALGLCHERHAGALLEKIPGRLIRHDAPAGRIRIALRSPGGDHYEIETRIERQPDSGIEVLRRTTTPETGFPWDWLFVCGYGPQRALVAERSYKEYSAFDAVAGLFDPGASLQNPELVWLRQGEAERARIGDTLRDVLMLERDGDVEAAALRQRPGRELELAAPWGTWPLRAQSDGYRSTAQWVLDLIGWAIYAGRFAAGNRDPSAEPAGPAGIVLVDELEQHLHPRWQRHIVARLARQFPKIQFIASTHTPMVAAGVADRDDAAIFTLETRAADAARASDARQIPLASLRGRRADQVLTSPAFGLATSRSPGSAGELARYSELLGKPGRTAEEEAELEELADSLEGSLAFGETPVEQAVEHAVRDALDAMLETRLGALTSGASAGADRNRDGDEPTRDGGLESFAAAAPDRGDTADDGTDGRERGAAAGAVDLEIKRQLRALFRREDES